MANSVTARPRLATRGGADRQTFFTFEDGRVGWVPVEPLETI